MTSRTKCCEGCGSIQVVGERCGICAYPKVGSLVVLQDHPASTPKEEVARHNIPLLDTFPEE